MRLSIILLSLLLVPLSAADALTQWHGEWFPSSGRVKGVALVIHGLNLKPAKMDELSRLLAAAGIEVLRVSLSGHGYGSFRDVTASGWLAETNAAYHAAAQRAQKLRVPLYFLGYSLGGLLGEVLLATSPVAAHVHFTRAVLLAPAIALRPVVYLVKFLFLFGRGFTLPSADLPSYRAHSGTPMAAYEALFRLVAMLRAERFRETNLPTKVFVRSDDELVSLKGIRTLVRTYALSHWSISVIPNRGVAGYPHHLIVDEPSLGAAEWRSMSASILRFFDGSEDEVPDGIGDGHR